jgi:hypothetical protein
MVWLNVALQPCAMAFGGDNDHGCLHCPSADSGGVSSNMAHEADHSESSTPPCEPNASQCTFLDGFKHDGRTANVKVEDAPDDVPVAILPSAAVFPLGNSLSRLPGMGDMSYLPGDSPSLNVLYGVYLI